MSEPVLHTVSRIVLLLRCNTCGAPAGHLKTSGRIPAAKTVDEIMSDVKWESRIDRCEHRPVYPEIETLRSKIAQAARCGLGLVDAPVTIRA